VLVLGATVVEVVLVDELVDELVDVLVVVLVVGVTANEFADTAPDPIVFFAVTRNR
jgi:hypothetical protein